ncbi:MAG: zf-TFIIB domain-containing protein [Sporolactobacillus sp.]|jgi:Zn-finger nucleic acid-binding protein|nr:zf-TFIIB domain-containing protein [Sporolactobacillus sp.]MCI1882566.1 zf-TFIIB domain-containing protein [Sporolactobacillus sp.]
MKEIERDHVLVDICPNCKGIWLDRGEIDKISGRIREERRSFHDRHDDDEWNHYDDDRHYRRDKGDADGRYRQPPRKRKKRSVADLFGDLFD